MIIGKLHAVIGIFGAVTGTTLEEIIIGFDVGSEIHNFSSRQLPGGIKHDRMTMMIGTFKMTRKPNIADIFAALCGVCGRDFVFGEDGGKWTFGNTCPAVNAGVGINIDPGPFCNRLSGNHALYRADINTTAVANA